MAARAKQQRPSEAPGLRRTTERDCASAPDADAHRVALLALVDDLAVLAADLWFSGQLDAVPTDEDPADEDE